MVPCKSYKQATGFSYSLTNCLYASLIQRIEQDCGCSASFAAMFNTEAARGAEAGLATCAGAALVCMEAIMLNTSSLNTVRNTLDNRVTECLPVTLQYSWRNNL